MKSKYLFFIGVILISLSGSANFSGGSDSAIKQVVDFFLGESAQVLGGLTTFCMIGGALSMIGGFVMLAQSLKMSMILFLIGSGLFSSPRIATHLSQVGAEHNFSKLIQR